MKYKGILEEELKIRIGNDYFSNFDAVDKIGKVDFAVKYKNPNLDIFDAAYFMWAEAKKDIIADVNKAFTQLILTIGRATTFYTHNPPPFLACFDYEKIAFIPYSEISHIFFKTDFNWNVTPSDYDSKEFKQLYKSIDKILETTKTTFYYEDDDNELKDFITTNFDISKTSISKIQITKENFMVIYSKWLLKVKPSITMPSWEAWRQKNIIEADFYLADILSNDNKTIVDKLQILLKHDMYRINLGNFADNVDMFTEIGFNDNQKAHNEFWLRYERPPKNEYFAFILGRRDLLIPQDIRERKGSFYTPLQWVSLSHKYLADELGDNWQDEYIVWDCAAGTGNLLAGLTNARNIYASTLDEQDVIIMREGIANGANMLVDNVFQFDFLNDDFSKLPTSLQKIINDEEQRKKLLIYINPPYAEGDSKIGKGRKNIHVSKIHDIYAKEMGGASAELSALFMARIYKELNGCMIGDFSKLNILQSPKFKAFRNNLVAKLKKMFIIPADTFDNVKGKFAIGFKIWDSSKKFTNEKFYKADVYNHSAKYAGKKKIYTYTNKQFISSLLVKPKSEKNDYIGHIASVGNDFQHNDKDVYIDDVDRRKINGGRHTFIDKDNLIVACVVFAVRKVIAATWLNDKDQFLYPKDSWQKDNIFQTNCLAYTLFHNANNIQSKYGTNHWIPFTEIEVGAKGRFDSDFMVRFIAGKIETEANLFNHNDKQKTNKIEFSDEALAVINAGRELWSYYHAKIQDMPNSSVNASFYDIKEFFKGRSDENSNDGRMNNKSPDEHYNNLMTKLKNAMDILALQIETKVYEHEFLLD